MVEQGNIVEGRATCNISLGNGNTNNFALEKQCLEENSLVLPFLNQLSSKHDTPQSFNSVTSNSTEAWVKICSTVKHGQVHEFREKGIRRKKFKHEASILVSVTEDHQFTAFMIQKETTGQYFSCTTTKQPNATASCLLRVEGGCRTSLLRKD